MDDEIQRLVRRVKAAGKQGEFLCALASSGETSDELFDGRTMHRAAWWTEPGLDQLKRLKMRFPKIEKVRFAMQMREKQWWMPQPSQEWISTGNNESALVYTFPPLLPLVSFTLHGLSVVDEEGVLVAFAQFAASIPVTRGDILNLSYNIEVDLGK